MGKRIALFILGLSCFLGLLIVTWLRPQASTPLPAASHATPTPRQYPQRIISLVPSVTELIYAVGAENRLVGVTTNDHYPPEVARLPKVGDQTIDPERLLALHPDLVILDTAFNSEAASYRRLGIPSLALSSHRLNDIPKNLILLGDKLGLSEQAQGVAERFKQNLQKVSKPPRSTTVFIEIWGSPLMTAGTQTLPDDLLLQLGLKNVYSDQVGYFQVDPEDVVSRQPHLIILPVNSSSTDLGVTSLQSQALKLLKKAQVPCKLITIDGALFTNPTPRVLEGLHQITNRLQAP